MSSFNKLKKAKARVKYMQGVDFFVRFIFFFVFFAFSLALEDDESLRKLRNVFSFYK